MVEKEGADATFCGSGRRMDGAKKFFTELENFFSAREEKSTGFSFRKQQNLLEKGGRLCYSM